MTRDAPRSFANWPTRLPTAPAAPDTKTTSPGANAANRNSPAQAVSPGIPSTPRYSDSGRPGRGGATSTWTGGAEGPPGAGRGGSADVSPPAQPVQHQRPDRDVVGPAVDHPADRTALHRLAQFPAGRVGLGRVHPAPHVRDDPPGTPLPDHLSPRRVRPLEGDQREVLVHRLPVRPADQLPLAGAD